MDLGSRTRVCMLVDMSELLMACVYVCVSGALMHVVFKVKGGQCRDDLCTAVYPLPGMTFLVCLEVVWNVIVSICRLFL